MKHFIVLIFLLLSFKTYGQASPAVIYNAGYGKVIPEFGLRFKDNKTLISGALNPSVTPTDAPIGSIYISSNGLTYQKQDNGSTTNWTPLYFVPIFTDDNRLVRTDGTDNVQQSGVTLSDLDAMTGLTSLTVDSINLDSYIISTTALDQALELKPNGTGTVDIPYLTNGAALFAGSNGAVSQDFANYQYSILDGLKVDNLRLNGNTVLSDNLNGNINLAPNGTGDVVVSTLTDGRVVYNASGALVDDAGFTFNGTTDVLKVGDLDIGGLNTITTSALNTDLVLDANGTGKVDVNAPINIESVVSNQVVFADASTSNLTGDASFIYDASLDVLTVSELSFGTAVISSTVTNQNITLTPNGTGEVDVNSPMNVENIRLDTNAITATNTNGDLTLAANGTGVVIAEGITFDGAVIGSSATNGDITLTPNGIGEVEVSSPLNVEGLRIDTNEISSSGDLTLSSLAGEEVILGSDTAVRLNTNNILYTNSIGTRLLDPQILTNSLLLNGDFESSEVEYACTNATGALVPATLDTPNNNGMFRMTVTGAGGHCDFTYATGAIFEGLPFRMGGLFQSVLTDVEYCTLVNGAVDNCVPVSAGTAFKQPLATQSIAGATSVGIRIRTTSSTSGVVNVDKLQLSLGGLPTGPTISCDGDLDCENVFSASVSTSNVVTQDDFGFISSCSGSNPRTCNFTEGIFTSTPKCTAQVVPPSGYSPGFSFNITAKSSTSLSFRRLEENGYLKDAQALITCTKAAPDFKPITQQGAVNVGTADGALLIVTNEDVTTNQTVGAATITLPFGTVKDSRQISWNTTTEEATFLKGGLFGLTLEIQPFSLSGSLTQSFFPEIDKGAGFIALPNDNSKCFARNQATVNQLNTLSCRFVFNAQAGDRVRMRAQGSAAAALIYNSEGHYPRMIISQQVDQQTIAASLEGVSKIEGVSKPVEYTQHISCLATSIIGEAFGSTELFATLGNISSGNCSFTINSLFQASALPNSEPFCTTGSTSSSLASVGWNLVWSSATGGTLQCRAGAGNCTAGGSLIVTCKGQVPL